MSPITKRIDKPSRILVCDPSGSHFAFTICELDPINSTFTIVDAGIIWTSDKWNLGQRFTYMYKCLEYLVKEAEIDSIITEAFFSSPTMRSGTHIVPTINNFMQMIAYRADKEVSYEEVSPSAWRKPLCIKPDMLGTKRDFKAPTKRKVEEMLGKLPEEVVSNITGNLRSLPTDVPDALAISLYVALDHNIISIDKGTNIRYNKYSTVLKELINVK